MGLGDVASILIPALKIIRRRYPDAEIDVLTFGPACELMELVEDVHALLRIEKEQWPSPILDGVLSFQSIGEVVMAQQYDKIINYDTWYMPCFLARYLMECGEPVEGNYLNMATKELLSGILNNSLSGESIERPDQYMDSTFKNMGDWHVPWWDRYPEHYPSYYLNHCCGYEEEVNISIEIDFDDTVFANMTDKKIIALSTSGRVASKQYPHEDELKAELEKRDYFVWGQFDGSVPMSTTLSRFHKSDLLITVPTATQWLAKLAGCPSLIISGPLPPVVLSGELTVERIVDCQYCFQNECINGSGFSCMDIDPKAVVEQVDRYFDSK